MIDPGERPNESELGLSATPEVEDFRGKYESGRMGQRLLNRYFEQVGELLGYVDTVGKPQAIEIGCGEGLSTMRIRRLLDGSVRFEASEYVPGQVLAARKNNPGMEVVQESIYDLTHEAGSFDIVFLLEVLEHLDHPGAALREIDRISKPGGYLIAGVPREPLWRLLNMARGKYVGSLGNTPGHLNHWSKRAFVRYLDSFFAEIVAVRSPLPWTLVLARKAKGGPR